MLARTAFLLLPEAGFLECANVWDSRGKETYEECILRASTTHIHLECGLELHVKLGTREEAAQKDRCAVMVTYRPLCQEFTPACVLICACL